MLCNDTKVLSRGLSTSEQYLLQLDLATKRSSHLEYAKLTIKRKMYREYLEERYAFNSINEILSIYFNDDDKTFPAWPEDEDANPEVAFLPRFSMVYEYPDPATGTDDDVPF